MCHETKITHAPSWMSTKWKLTNRCKCQLHGELSLERSLATVATPPFAPAHTYITEKIQWIITLNGAFKALQNGGWHLALQLLCHLTRHMQTSLKSVGLTSHVQLLNNWWAQEKRSSFAEIQKKNKQKHGKNLPLSESDKLSWRHTLHSNLRRTTMRAWQTEELAALHFVPRNGTLHRPGHRFRKTGPGAPLINLDTCDG